VADREGYVHLLQREDGAMAARARPDSSQVLAMRAYGRGVLVQTQAGGVYALSVQ
jgi:outer membrane protein assembly factor BamB